MSRREVIQAERASYLVALDGVSEYRALVVGSVQDAVTGTAPLRALRVRSAHSGIYAKIVDNHLLCLAGDAARVFPGLGFASDTLEATLSADGYHDTGLTLAVPANATFPIQLPTSILLEPLPGRVQGRVMTNAATPAPIANALVTIVDPTLPLPEHVMVLREPLHFMHPAATAVRERSLTATGTVKHLVYGSGVGAADLVLDERGGLAPNSVLRIGSGEAIEYAAIASLNPIPANPALPGRVTLFHPLARSFPAATPVTAVTPGVIGASASLSRAVRAGDALLILNAPLAAASVEIADAVAARVEYHAVGTRSNADGYYDLDGVGRVVNF